MNFPTQFKRFIVYRRLAEIFLPCIIFSTFITLFNVSGVVYKRYNVIIMILAFVLIFTIYNFIKLRRCYFDMRNKKLFYMLNFISHGIFAAVNIILFAFVPNKVYAWFFAITKALTFLNIDTIYSILFFHFVGLLCIVASPIGMKWIFDKGDEEDKPIEYIE